MSNLVESIKDLTMLTGADLVGIASCDRLAGGPPSGDPRYVLPSARSVICFAVAVDREAARSFIAKEDWLSHGEDRKAVVKKLYTIGDTVVEFLQDKGFDAVNVDINSRYRPEQGASDITEMTEFYPDFSHRYGAVAAGIGRLGWSGNLMTARFGALVELGSVITSAKLEEDPILEENPCDSCKNCALVCPVGMISSREQMEVEVAGITEIIAKKRPNTCCWIGCSGYEGLSADGTWSNWSPYRLSRRLPDGKKGLDNLCIRLQKADPQMSMEVNVFNDYRAAVFDPDWFYYTVCGFCRSVCQAARDERVASRKALHRSGIAALDSDGMHVVAKGETARVSTPFGLDVVLPDGELDKLYEQSGVNGGAVARWPMDREVLSWLSKGPRD